MLFFFVLFSDSSNYYHTDDQWFGVQQLSLGPYFISCTSGYQYPEFNDGWWCGVFEISNNKIITYIDPYLINWTQEYLDLYGITLVTKNNRILNIVEEYTGYDTTYPMGFYCDVTL